MRKSLLALMIVAMMLVVAVPCVMAEDTSDTDANATFDGKIIGQVSHSGGKPMESPSTMVIVVYTLDEQGDKKPVGTYEGRLDSKGYFSVPLEEPVDKSKTYISFLETGYVVSGKSSCMDIDEYGRFKIDFDKAVISTAGDTCEITQPMDYIWMTSNHGGIITGKVVSSSGGNPPLNGVKVTITSTIGNETRTEFTSGDGSFKFSNVGVGTYTLVAESKGFETYVYNDLIVVDSEEPWVQPTIKMTPNQDIDTSHWMTIGGIIAALILLLAVAIHIYRVKKKKKSSDQ